MKFNSPEELLEFMNTIDLEKSTLVFRTDKPESSESGGCGCGGEDESVCACTTVNVSEEDTTTIVESGHILIESFSDTPKFNLVISETEDNIFFVKDFNALQDACGTGSITLDDRVTHMNMCEMDNIATVTLDIIAEGKKLKGVPFTLVKSELPSYLQLSKARLL